MTLRVRCESGEFKLPHHSVLRVDKSGPCANRGHNTCWWATLRQVCHAFAYQQALRSIW